MKRMQMLIRVGLVVGLGGIAFVLLSQAEGGAGGIFVVAYDEGGAAAAPLPVGAPVVDFDPSEDLADVDGSIVVSTGSSALRFTDGTTGEQLGTRAIDPRAELRAVSADGSLAALYENRSDQSTITVASIDGGRANREFVFDGLVEPEAFATDGSLLYVIDHQAGQTPGAYRVRPLHLATGELGVMLGPQKVPIPEEMNGSARRQIWAPRGDRLYTLYIRQTVHVHSDGHGHANGTEGTDGFVHILDLNQEWAFCLHLPEGFGTSELAETAIALDPSGERLAILDLNAGRLAWASTKDLTIDSVIDLPSGLDADGAVHMAVTKDHLAIGWGTEVHWFMRDTFAETKQVDFVGSTLQGMTALGDTVLAWTGTVKQLAPPAI